QFDRRLHHLPDAVRRHIGRVGRPCPLADQDAQPHGARSRLFQALDIAHPDRRGELVPLGNRTLGVLGARRQRLLYGVRRQLGQMILAHAVPPTVMRSILMVGIPTPTGTLCPSLPQVPMPSSSRRSLPTMLTYFSASGPLPIRVALRTGRPSLPSSIR